MTRNNEDLIGKVPSAFGPRWSRWLGRFLAKVVWNTKVVGAKLIPRKGAVLVAPNHVGVIDGPLVHGVIRRGSHFLVKREFFSSKLGFLMRWSGQIYTDRRNGRGALTAGLAVLRRGGVVGVFPEGFRGQGRAESVQAGIAWLHVHGGAPIVPCAVLGTRRTGQRVGHVPGFRTKLVVEFGEPFTVPLPVGGSRRDHVGIATEQIRQRLAEHVLAASRRHNIPLPSDGPQNQGQLEE